MSALCVAISRAAGRTASRRSGRPSTMIEHAIQGNVYLKSGHVGYMNNSNTLRRSAVGGLAVLQSKVRDYCTKAHLSPLGGWLSVQTTHAPLSLLTSTSYPRAISRACMSQDSTTDNGDNTDTVRKTPTKRVRKAPIGIRPCDPAFSVATKAPQLVHMWHDEANLPRTPQNTFFKAHARIWWRCPEGPDHIFQQSVARLSGPKTIGCPYCANRKVSVTNCLATVNPKIADQWHRKKNGELTPYNVVYGSDLRVWWKCEEGPDHVWKARVRKRVMAAHGCPYCKHRKDSQGATIAMVPELMKQFYLEKNAAEGVYPDEIMSYTTKDLVWWRCPDNPEHVWKQVPNLRKRFGCPFCADNTTKVTPEESLAAAVPRLIHEWDTEYNAMSPYEIRCMSAYNAWWRCRKNKDHPRWRAKVYARSRSGGRHKSCPTCQQQERAEVAHIHPMLDEVYEE